MISDKTASELITELNEMDETESLEAKSISTSTVGKSFFETVCAMSNEPGLEGGTILLGVEKELALFPLYSPVGVHDPEKVSSDIASGCATMFNNPVRVNVSTERVGKTNVIRVDVPELPSHQKPVYFSATGLPRGAYRRIGSTDQRCTEEDLLLFYQNRENAAYDTSVLEQAELDDIDPLAIEAYRKIRRAANPLAEELNWSDEDLLHSLGGLRRLDGRMRVTVAGLITFGKSSALRRICPAHRVDYIRVPGTMWVNDVGKQFDSVEMRGPLMTLVPRVIAAIMDDLPRAFAFESGSAGQRSELPLLPAVAIREAVVNSLIHRSYQVTQPVQIVRYSNRLEFKNPGYSLKSAERFDDPASVMRNPHIAEVLHETRFAETKGSGIRRMRQFMEESGLSSPTFDSDRENDNFSAIFLFHHFLNPEDWNWLSRFNEFDLSDDQRRALIFVREVGAIDNQTYRSLTHTDTLSASKSLRKLRTAELLTDRGSGARTYYVPGPTLLGRVRVDEGTTKNYSQDMQPRSQGSAANSQGSDTQFVEMPETLRKKIKLLALVTKPTADQIESAIIDLCRWKPLAASEIGALISRVPSYLTQNYLSKMVRDGRLKFLYPDQQNHPQQKYISGSSSDKTTKRK